VTADEGELGGMYVDPDRRGRGIAEALVRALVDAAPQPTLWCLPFARLDALYRRCGFAAAPAADPVPDAVAAKLAWCNETYPEPVILLRRTR
jgi:GNAT superfamily N-acetyltransferase